jgi:peroxiredoxin
LLLTAAWQGPREPSPKNPEALGPAPPFSLPSLRELKLLTNADFAGKVVLIVIERSDSAASQRDASYLQALRGKFVSRGFEILAVSDENFDARVDPVSRALQFATQNKWEFPLAMNDGGEFHAGYYRRLRGTPSGYLLHRNGSLEFLGQDPARIEFRDDLEKLIETRLEEKPEGEAPSPPATPMLPGFTAVSWKGGAIRDTDLRGKPAILALLTPSMLPRFGPPLSSIAVKYGPLGLRVVAIVFGKNREVLEELAARPPAFDVAAPDSECQEALIGPDYVPKFVFVSADSRIVKSIGTIYGARDGVEGAVFERYAAMLMGRYATTPRAAETGAALSRLAYRSAELGFGIDPPAGFKSDPTSTAARTRFTGPEGQELTIVFETRFGNNAESVDKILAVLGTGLEGRQVGAKEAWTGELAGAVSVLESWSTPLGTVKARRLFVPSGAGVYVVTASAPEGAFARLETAFRGALESFRTGKP